MAHNGRGGAKLSGYSRIYVIGSQDGFMGADGVNPIDFLVLVGDADCQWLEPRHFNCSIEPLGKLRVIISAGPNYRDSLLDACMMFCPRYLRKCLSLHKVKPGLQDAEQFDFNARPQEIPTGWARLRDEARPTLAEMGVWQADLVPITRAE